MVTEKKGLTIKAVERGLDRIGKTTSCQLGISPNLLSVSTTHFLNSLKIQDFLQDIVMAQSLLPILQLKKKKSTGSKQNKRIGGD